VEKAHFSKGYQNPKRNLGVALHFSEILELNFGKKLPYILCILRFFRIMAAHLSLKNAWLPIFSFWIPITLTKIYFFPKVITFAKIPLY